MQLLIALLTLALVAFVVLLVSAPLRRPARPASVAAEEVPAGDGISPSALLTASEREQLEAAREAKYREIRDCELDYRTGKLSHEDFEATDAQLRAEALLILDRLEPGADAAGEEA